MSRQIRCSIVLLSLCLVGSNLGINGRALRSTKPAGQLVAKNEKKNVAIFLYEGFQIIDFTGPFEVLSYTFNVYAVGEKNQPFRASGGMLAMPNYTFDDFPKPDILVIPDR